MNPQARAHGAENLQIDPAVVRDERLFHIAFGVGVDVQHQGGGVAGEVEGVEREPLGPPAARLHGLFIQLRGSV